MRHEMNVDEQARYDNYRTEFVQRRINQVVEECPMSADCGWLNGNTWKTCPYFRLQIAFEIEHLGGKARRETFGLSPNEHYLDESSNTLRCDLFELESGHNNFMRVHGSLSGPHNQLFRRCGVMNGSEQPLLRIINDADIGKFKFVGNRPTAGRLKPDFISVGGEKLAIEMFGDYWHKDDNPAERILFLQKHGYRTAVIWEHSLRNEDLIKKNLREFYCGTRHSVVI